MDPSKSFGALTALMRIVNVRWIYDTLQIASARLWERHKYLAITSFVVAHTMRTIGAFLPVFSTTSPIGM
jgi:hypothetical protein